MPYDCVFKGTLIATSLDAAVIDVQGVGYQVLMASKSLARLGMPGDTVRVLTHLQIRDDALVLYGFLNQEEKICFASSFGFQCWAEGGFSGAFHF